MPRVTYLVQKVYYFVEEIGALAIFEFFVVKDFRLLHEVTLAQICIRITVLRRLIEVIVGSFAHFCFNHCFFF